MSIQVNYGHINLSRLDAINVANVQTNYYNNTTTAQQQQQQQIVLLPTQKDFIEHYIANGELWDAEAIMAKRKIIAHLTVEN